MGSSLCSEFATIEIIGSCLTALSSNLVFSSGQEVNDGQTLEMVDMGWTSLGIGVGKNYSFDWVPRQPQVPPPLLPQELYQDANSYR